MIVNESGNKKLLYRIWGTSHRLEVRAKSPKEAGSKFRSKYPKEVITQVDVKEPYYDPENGMTADDGKLMWKYNAMSPKLLESTKDRKFKSEIDEDSSYVIASQISANIEGENDAITGYYKLLDMLSGDEIDEINEIISDEKNHIDRLSKMLLKYDGGIPTANESINNDNKRRKLSEKKDIKFTVDYYRDYEDESGFIIKCSDKKYLDDAKNLRKLSDVLGYEVKFTGFDNSAIVITDGDDSDDCADDIQAMLDNFSSRLNESKIHRKLSERKAIPDIEHYPDVLSATLSVPINEKTGADDFIEFSKNKVTNVILSHDGGNHVIVTSLPFNKLSKLVADYNKAKNAKLYAINDRSKGSFEFTANCEDYLKSNINESVNINEDTNKYDVREFSTESEADEFVKDNNLEDYKIQVSNSGEHDKTYVYYKKSELDLNESRISNQELVDCMDVLPEYELLETQGLELDTFSHPDGVGVTINGTRYVYHSDQFDDKTLERKFKGILKYSAGKALTWIKKVSEPAIRIQ